MKTIKTDSLPLSRVDWKVWFLGGGLGGAFGLCTLALILNINNPSPLVFWAPILLGGVHAVVVCSYWINRHAASFIKAWRVTMTISATCTLLLALALFNDAAQSNSGSTLVMLAMLQGAFAVTCPMYYQPDQKIHNRK